MLTFLGLGILAGFVASTPLGPINMVFADRVLAKIQNQWTSFLSGVIIIDTLFAMLALWGFRSWLEALAANDFIVGIGGGFLIILGLSQFFRDKVKMRYNLPKSGDFFKGILLCGFNPGFFIYWIFIADQIAEWKNINSNDLVLVYGIGVALGNMLWFWVFFNILRKTSSGMGEKAIKIIRYSLAMVIILFGVFALASHFI